MSISTKIEASDRQTVNGATVNEALSHAMLLDPDRPSGISP
jgi:hypothetical protein